MDDCLATRQDTVPGAVAAPTPGDSAKEPPMVRIAAQAAARPEPPAPPTPQAEATAGREGECPARARHASQARHASGRRRRVDPTTCERDYSDAELEFLHAMQDYKARSGRLFPTWSEALEVLRSLG